MQTDLSDDQVLFHETTVRFIESELPVSRTRELHDDPAGYDRAWLRRGAGRTRELHDDPAGYDRAWLRRGAGIGWFAMLVPEDDGGGSISGDGLVDAAIVAEELGRHVQPGPFVPMNVVAGAIASHGTAAHRAELLPGIVAADLIATWAFADEGGNWDEGAGLRAEHDGDALILDGCRGFVQDAGTADWLLVAASLDGKPVQLLVPSATPGVHVRLLDSLDLSRRFAHVDFEQVAAPAGAVLSRGQDAFERQLLHALVLTCADTVGAVDALLEMTIDYSKERVAFGRPIGSFQALKHVMADQALYVETCKAGVAAAARAVQDGDDAASEVASMVAAYVGDVANDVAQECLQIHGGIGYTWEHDLHLYLRRVRSNSSLFGEPTWHRERVCRFHHLGEGEGRPGHGDGPPGAGDGPPGAGDARPGAGDALPGAGDRR